MDLRRVALLSVVALAGCGGDAAPPAPAPQGPAPALATAPPRSGEVVLRGELSPRVHGPLALDGRYRVRFVQYAPEDARTDFTAQTPFVVDLRRAADRPGQRLFRAARAAGQRTLTLHGRYLVDVSFGDFPYVLRFTRVD
jgi:hypothetical protein